MGVLADVRRHARRLSADASDRTDGHAAAGLHLSRRQRYAVLNLVSTIGSAILALGILLFLVDVARNFRWAPADGNAGNVFGGVARMAALGALLDPLDPAGHQPRALVGPARACAKVEEGRYFLPNSATGLRETIVTSPVMAEPEYVEIMPGPSPWPSRRRCSPRSSSSR